MSVNVQDVDMDTITTSTSSTAVGVVLRSATDWRPWIQRLQRLVEARQIWEYLENDSGKISETPPEPEWSTLQALQGIAHSQQATVATLLRTVTVC